MCYMLKLFSIVIKIYFIRLGALTIVKKKMCLKGKGIENSRYRWNDKKRLLINMICILG